MIKGEAKAYTLLQYFIDISLTIVSLPLAYYLRLHLAELVPEGLAQLLHPEIHPLSDYLLLLLAIIPLWSLLLFWLGSYQQLTRILIVEQAKLLLKLEIFAGVILGFVLFALKLNLSRPLILFFLTINFCLLLLERVVIKKYQQATGQKYRSILLVGSGDEAREMAGLIRRYEDWRLKVIGYVALEEPSEAGGLKMLGRAEDLPRIIEENVIDEVIFVGSEKRDLDKFEQIYSTCEEQGIRTRLVANFLPQKIARLSVEYLDHVPLITFSTAPDQQLALLIKRLIDMVLSAALLVALSPLMLVVAILIKLTSPGPIIYRQTRCGLYGRQFTLYKFRSMIQGAEDILWEIKHLNEMGGPVFKMRNDPRVTKLGRYLRKFSIDELPQLYNVLKGDMSLVGPRAPLPEEVRHYTRWQRRRLSVKPGITCLWQISGRNEIDFDQWMNLDLQYIDNWSLWLDFKILLKTIPVVLLAKGAR